ncbi:heavy metal sensor signal transduction histidine kinase [Burkholderia plantarii]|uniref:Sensor protein n=2 Tax=Burkholderia plantarii TaxID=41899 RepID=A0A0B6RYS0_BURPL|nr:heavy metal sensor histidine kinase [Burkholderia plantarii]AJK48538.1 heavy metal sensor signal transduction histidine kinase [Burkholderia plantarii]
MRPVRSLTTALAVAFAAMTLAVFALVGTYVYLALDRQVRAQDDLDVVLAARHARRLAAELESAADVRAHAERLTSVVFGNAALSFAVAADDGRLIASHNVAATAPGDPRVDPHLDPHLVPPSGVAASTKEAADDGADDPPDHGAAADSIELPASVSLASLLPGPPYRVPADTRIVRDQIMSWVTPRGVPVHGIVVDVRLRDGAVMQLMIARNLHDGTVMLDRYRDTLKLAGGIGALLSVLFGYALIRLSMRPLRGVVEATGRITVDRLDTRLDAHRVPRELVPLVEAVNAMLARLQHGFRLLSQFSADLAHDLRTPLNNMRGATEVALSRRRSADDYEALLESNLEEYDRLARMIENVLFLARAEHPGFVTHRREFDVHEELTRIAGYFEGLADEAGSVLRVTGSGRLSADLELFRRAVGNLLANALRYTPRGGEIRLAVEETDTALCVRVENQGEPIDAEHLPRIFDRFYRGDAARSRHSPSGGASGVAGLGLAIVRSVMELHGGSAWAERLDDGMRFVLRFPRQG